MSKITNNKKQRQNKNNLDPQVEKLADEISFKLLATRNHPDYEWLNKKLKTWKNTFTEEN